MGADLTTPDLDRLLAALDATWAAAGRVPLGDWVVRRGAGAGRRVGSVWTKGDPGTDPATAVARAGEIAARWGEPLFLQVREGDEALDALLAERGFTVEAPSRLMAADVAAVAAHGVGDRMVVEVRAPLIVLDELWQAGHVDAPRRAVMERTPLPKIRLMLREDDRPAAAAFVAVDGDVAMLHALVVGPGFRRRGVGRAATAAAAHWALGQGAATLGLAVEAGNDAALALYRGMGFRDCGGYHYRKQG